MVLGGCLLVIAGLWAYHNSFKGVFLFDDTAHIVENVKIRRLWPLQHVLTESMRPVVDLSLAANYALGGLNVWGYHALNLAIHLLAALTLFGVVRRALAGARLRHRYGAAASGFSLTAALIWAVHPLQTQSVTYVIQRAESLVGLFYLLTLYGVIRGASSRRAGAWYAAAIASCAMGMASKPVMATAPVAVLLYDRLFVADSFRDLIARRKHLYLGLAGTWGLLAALLHHMSSMSDPTAGFGFKGVTPTEYALTQAGVVLHYLKLAVWPHALVLDYGWPVARTAEVIVLPMIAVGGLALITAWSLVRYPRTGFLGLCFFLILMPSSSVIPIQDLAFEYRMYLPLAPLAILFVLGGYEGLRWMLPFHARARRWVAVGCAGFMVVSLGLATIRRNEDYRSEMTMWRDVVARRPENPRGYNSLGRALSDQGRFKEAVPYHERALQLKPAFPNAHNNLGLALAAQGKFEEAVTHCQEALRLDPRFEEAHYNLGLVLVEQNKVEEAIQHYTEALRLKPEYADAHHALGLALFKQGTLADAVAHYRESIRLNPNFANAHHNLGLALAKTGALEEAIAEYREAIQLNPEFAEAYANLGNALARQNRLEEATAQYREALQLAPNAVQIHNNLGMTLVRQGQLDEATEEYKEALRLDPKFGQARQNLVNALIKQGKVDELAKYLKVEGPAATAPNPSQAANAPAAATEGIP